MEENIKATGDVPVAFDNLTHMESVKNRKRMRLIGIEPNVYLVKSIDFTGKNEDSIS